MYSWDKLRQVNIIMYFIDIMDIEKAKKLYISQIEADQNTRFVRDVIKTD